MYSLSGFSVEVRERTGGENKSWTGGTAPAKPRQHEQTGQVLGAGSARRLECRGSWRVRVKLGPRAAAGQKRPYSRQRRGLWNRSQTSGAGGARDGTCLLEEQ